MKNKLHIPVIIAVALSLSSPSLAQNTEPKNITKTHWLVGTWRGTYNGKPFYETWRKNADNSLTCYYIDISGKDTTVREQTSQIAVADGEIGYRSPEVFKASRLMDNEMVFDIDDPKIGKGRLIWFHTNDDHWWAILEYSKMTAYYDLVRDPLVDKAISSKLKRK
jgi:hypothetical protein